MATNQKTSEHDLILRARQGDEDAFQALLRRHEELLRKRVQRWVSPRLRRKISASDVLQEAYIVALRRFADFEDRGDGSFGRWLGQIVELKLREAVRQAGAAKRDAGREVSRDGRMDTRNFMGQQTSPSQAAIASELKEAARVALEKMPDDYRRIIRLVQQDQVSFETAARKLGRTLAATRKLYGRAVARFTELLGKERGDS